MFIKHLCAHRKTSLGKHRIVCGIEMDKRLTVAQRCLCLYSQCKNQSFGHRSTLTSSPLHISKTSSLRTKQIIVPKKLFSDFFSETICDNEHDEVTEENMKKLLTQVM